MADNTISYTAIQRAKSIISKSTDDIEEKAKSMNANIDENYAKEGGNALSGDAAAALAAAWSDFSTTTFPPLENKLIELTNDKLAPWEEMFKASEQKIVENSNNFDNGN